MIKTLRAKRHISSLTPRTSRFRSTPLFVTNQEALAVSCMCRRMRQRMPQRTSVDTSVDYQAQCFCLEMLQDFNVKVEVVSSVNSITPKSDM